MLHSDPCCEKKSGEDASPSVLVDAQDHIDESSRGQIRGKPAEGRPGAGKAQSPPDGQKQKGRDGGGDEKTGCFPEDAYGKRVQQEKDGDGRIEAVLPTAVFAHQSVGQGQSQSGRQERKGRLRQGRRLERRLKKDVTGHGACGEIFPDSGAQDPDPPDDCGRAEELSITGSGTVPEDEART